MSAGPVPVDPTYLALVPALVVEGPVATLVAGTLVGAGHAALTVVWVLAVVVDLVVDSLLFALGRSGRRPGPARLLARLGLTPSRRARLAAAADADLAQLVGAAKLVDAGAVPALLAAGLSGVRYRRFLALAAGFTALRVSALVGAGALLGTHLAARVGGLLDRPWLVVLVGLGSGLVLLAGRSLVRRLRADRAARHRVLPAGRLLAGRA